MARVTVEDCLERVTDQFALVHLCALRYRQLHRGAGRLTESKNKDIVTALREIATGSVRFREDVAEMVLKSAKGMVSQRLDSLAAEAMDQADDPMDNSTPLI